MNNSLRNDTYTGNINLKCSSLHMQMIKKLKLNEPQHIFLRLNPQFIFVIQPTLNHICIITYRTSIKQVMLMRNRKVCFYWLSLRLIAARYSCFYRNSETKLISGVGFQNKRILVGMKSESGFGLKR